MMDGMMVFVVGGLVTASVYMFLARDLARVLIGFALLGIAANLVILASGRVGAITPPFVAGDATVLSATAANSLPQALILTAIVIGFGLAAFALMLIVKAHAAFGTLASDEMHEAEADEETNPENKPGGSGSRTVAAPRQALSVEREHA